MYNYLIIIAKYFRIQLNVYFLKFVVVQKLYINAEFMDGSEKNDKEYERYTEEPGKIL